MKNLGTLFGYEMKKLWKRPMTWIAVLVFSAGFVYYAPIPFYHYVNTFTVTLADGRTISREVTVEEQDQVSIEAPRLLSGQVMDEEFFQRAQDVRSKLAPTELDTNLTGAYAYFQLVDPTYLGAYQLLSMKDYYLHRFDRFQEDVEGSWGNYLTEEEISYWERMEEQIQQPFIYEPTDAPNRLFDVLGTMGIFIPVLVALCVCDLFSQERRARTYPQIFTSKQGRKRLFLAKILAGGATSMLAAAIAVGAVIGSSLVRYGAWG